VLGRDSRNPAAMAEAKEILQEFLDRDLMLKEENLYLSLALLALRATGLELPQAQLAASAL